MFEVIVSVIFLLAAAGIVFWFLQKAPIPAPFNYIVYALMALIALAALWSIAHGFNPIELR